MKLILTVVIIITGAIIAFLYLPAPPATNSGFGGARPWRRLGAGITVVLTVMFALGIHWLEPRSNPVGTTVYWMIIMGLVIWLCGLAVKDMLHTRRELNRWRKARAQRDTNIDTSEEQ